MPLFLKHFRQLPLLTTGLVLLHALVFWVAQRDDDARFDSVITAYLDGPLYPMEAPNYLSYLAQSGHARDAGDLERTGDRRAIARQLLADRGFSYHLQQTGSDFWGASVFPVWREARVPINEALRSIIALRWGLDTHTRRLLTFLTWGFLSSSALHWSLTAIGLLLAGIPLERRWGFAPLAGLWVSGLIGGGLASLLLSPDTPTPLMGAEAGIVWLLGMGACRAVPTGTPIGRHIRLALPALAWILAMLLYTHLTPSPGPGIGRLALLFFTGTGIALILHQRGGRATPLATGVPTGTPEPADALGKAVDRLAALQLDTARHDLAVLRDQAPGDGRIWERLAGLSAYTHGPRTLSAVVPTALYAIASRPGESHSAHRLYDLYRRDASAAPLPAELVERLLPSALQQQNFAFAKALAKDAEHPVRGSERLVKGLVTLADALERINDPQAARIRQHADTLATRLAQPRASESPH